MVRTGGTLSAKMIELIGDLNEKETLKNIRASIQSIEKQMRSNNDRIRLYVELFARVEDIQKDVSEIQKKIRNNSNIKNIKLGVELSDMTVKDINEQIEQVQGKFDSAKTANKLKLDVEFDFTGSASKIKEEMDGIREFMQRYGEQMKNMDIINLDNDARNVQRNAEAMKISFGEVTNNTTEMSNRIQDKLREITGSTGKFSVDFKQDFNGAIQSAKASLTEADGTVRKFNIELDETSNTLRGVSSSTKLAGDQKERYADMISKADKAQTDFNKALANAPHDENTRNIMENVQAQQRLIEEMRETGRVTNEGSEAIDKLKNATRDLKAHTENLRLKEEFEEARDATRQAVAEFERLGGSEDDVRRFKDAIDEMSKSGQNATKEMEELGNEIRELGNQFDRTLSKTDQVTFRNAIQERDISTVRRYIEQLEGAEVATIKMTERKDRMGNSIDRVAVTMREVNGAVDSYTYDLNRSEDTLKRVNASTKKLTESTSQLDGGFRQIVSRVAQYFGAIELIQKAMQSLRMTVQEIRAIDEEMIELARVADPSINLATMLERSVELSKELGASVTQTLASVAEMARTFGDFNETQLMAIAETATIMTNVSELSIGEATSALVASIQAFNIEAEDSIRIVNALNEVELISLPAQKCA